MHLFSHDNHKGWQVLPLNGHAHNIPDSASCASSSEDAPRQGSSLVPDDRGWLLMSGRDSLPVQINGRLIDFGISRLRHQDEIVIGRQRFFFSTESAPSSEPFPGLPDDSSCLCPTCQMEITRNAPAVHCSCGVWSHENCYRYTEEARCCGRSTSPDAGLEFNPEEL